MVVGVIVSAGEGKRFGKRKQFIEVEGKPLMSYSLKVFEESKLIDSCVVVANKDEVEKCWEIIKVGGYEKVKEVVEGGKERQDSVRNALLKLSPETKFVVIHDGARPLLEEKMLENCLKEVGEEKGVAVAVPEVDTVKEVDERGFVVKTLDRKRLWRIQTPQAFPFLLLKELHEEAKVNNLYFTDDAALFEWGGYPVKVVLGSYKNIKLTHPEDLILIRAFLRERE